MARESTRPAARAPVAALSCLLLFSPWCGDAFLPHDGSLGPSRRAPTVTRRLASDNNGGGDEAGWVPAVARKANVLFAKLSLKDAAWRQKIANETQSAGLDISEYEGDPNGPVTVALRRLTELVEAETERARLIVESDGAAGIRPMDAPVPGPLGEAEKAATLALESVIAAEKERARRSREQGAMERPKNAPHPEMLGLLGELEQGTLDALGKLAASERERVKGGANYPPALLPENERSVLGDLEADARALVRGEVMRLQEMIDGGTLAVRPMDANMGPRDVDAVTGQPKSPLARAEKNLLATAETVRAYELARLNQLRESGVLPERPMNSDPSSIAGRAETFGVGVLRAPVMVAKTASRIVELLSDALTVADEAAEVEMDRFEKMDRESDAAAMAPSASSTTSASSATSSSSSSSSSSSADASGTIAETLKEGVTRAPALLSSVITVADAMIDETETAVKKKISDERSS